MTFPSTPRRQLRNTFRYVTAETTNVPMIYRALRHTMLLLGITAVLVVYASPRPATAWWQGNVSNRGFAGGYAWGPGPWVLFPSQRPRPDYRYSVPPGAPLSYDDPVSGTTFCWSQTTGFYFTCGYASPVAVGSGPAPPPPPGIPTSRADSTVPPASGVLLFRLPQGAQATIDGVPIGLSDGLGIHALAPGSHQVVLHVSGKETAHTVNVRSHKVFTVTPAGIVATEP